MRILIVDDEPAGIQSLKRGLQLLGHSVGVAVNGLEALEAFARERKSTDLIITDYSMPGMNGIDLLKAVRRENRKLPIVLVTAYGNQKVLMEALQNGCSGYLQKPFTLEQLDAEIIRIFGQGSVTQQ